MSLEKLKKQCQDIRTKNKNNLSKCIILADLALTILSIDKLNIGQEEIR